VSSGRLDEVDDVAVFALTADPEHIRQLDLVILND
jgi:hypothetical protein